MNKKNNLAIFDLDGTLFDTREVNYCAYQDALTAYNVDLDSDYFTSECNGKHYTDFLPKFLKKKEDIEIVHQIKKTRYAEHLNKALMNSHLFNIVRMIRSEYHIAVVTTASRKNTYEILNHFGVSEAFELIITSEDIVHVKPDPEGFFKAMDYFKMDSTHTIIFEDSDDGIQAALESGAAVLRVERF